MSLTITISDKAAGMFEGSYSSSEMREAIEKARASVKRGEVAITLSKDTADHYELEQPSGGWNTHALKICEQVKAARNTPYKTWLSTLSPQELTAWSAMCRTHAALKAANLGCSLRNLRAMAIAEFGTICVEGLPL